MTARLYRVWVLSVILALTLTASASCGSAQAHPVLESVSVIT
jgi:hypothetical protein